MADNDPTQNPELGDPDVDFEPESDEPDIEDDEPDEIDEGDARHQSEEFRAQDYDCQISKQRIHGLSSFNFSRFPATAGAPALPYCRESVYIIVLFTKKCKTFFIVLFVKKA